MTAAEPRAGEGAPLRTNVDPSAPRPVDSDEKVAASSAAAVQGTHKTVIGIIVLCTAGIAMSLTQTLIMPLIPSLPRILNTSASNASWAVTATMAVGAVVTPIVGRLGDMYGKRRLLLLCIAAVGVGSLICAVAPGLTVFLIGRALQGLGVAFVSVGISVMREFVPAAKLGTAVGMMSSSLAVGGALGLPFSAFVAEVYSWRLLFFLAVGGSVACYVGIYSLIPPSEIRTGGRFDLVGALGLSALLLALLLPLSKGPNWGWTSPITVSLGGSAILIFAGLVYYERRRSNPLLDLRIATRRDVMLANIVGVMAAFAFYGMELVPIQMLMAPSTAPHGLGVSMMAAGLLMAPAGVAAFVSSNIGARMVTAFGARSTLLTAGVLLIIAVGAMLIALVIAWQFPIAFLVGVTCVIGTSVGMSYATLPTLIMEATPIEQTGEANGLNALMRIIGLAAAAAVVGMILANNVTDTADTSLVVPSSSGYIWATTTTLVASMVATAAAMFLRRKQRTAVADIAP
ncbi:MFS transporter [Rhodococcus sp. (in: high G+C Gram-positive bacteria)]|uniref:MFS transporter n=1 Tax=Rhodococcus sp. TaxID=1831 RepID=UPI00257A93CE|nr:MFS transporter [Rhodococcus sp. (in: high G+C Gram-positive bacteria)]MBQ7803086.1 MFS transporter [Rhodococcus sp. (in: high G+C Gram-positive bacteria)]